MPTHHALIQENFLQQTLTLSNDKQVNQNICIQNYIVNGYQIK